MWRRSLPIIVAALALSGCFVDTALYSVKKMVHPETYDHQTCRGYVVAECVHQWESKGYYELKPLTTP